MERTLLVEVVSPDANLYRGEATSVIVTTKLGEMGIYPLHAPLVAELAPGEMRIKHGDDLGAMEVFSIYGGYVSVAEDHMLVLADLAIEVSATDTKRIEADIENAKERLKSLPEDAVDERLEVEHEIGWLNNCLVVAKRHQN
jgi:F-type H+-transporting ATPase subunit epsilon